MSEPEVVEPVVSDFRVTLGRGGRRRPERLAIAIAALLLVAILKPWGPGSPATTAPPPRYTPAPTAVVSAEAPPCTGSQWLIEADERWAGTYLRTWVFTEAVEALGPTDPAIKFPIIAGREVLAVGYCPSFWDDNRPHQRLTIYRIGDGEVEALPLIPVPVGELAGAAANVLFRRANTDVYPFVPPWPDGRYVMQISGPGTYERWLGFDIREVNLTPATPGPAATPGWDDSLVTLPPSYLP